MKNTNHLIYPSQLAQVLRGAASLEHDHAQQKILTQEQDVHRGPLAHV